MARELERRKALPQSSQGHLASAEFTGLFRPLSSDGSWGQVFRRAASGDRSGLPRISAMRKEERGF